MRTLFAIAFLALAFPAFAQEPLQITLLGTGNPRPSMERFGPSILVEAGETDILIDVGRGAIQRLFQIGAAQQIRDVDMVLFTHLHSDHVVGFPDFWLTGWVFGRHRPLAVMGPPGTKSMCDHLDQAFAFDKKVRGRDARYQNDGIVLETTDVEPSLIYDSGGLTITAFEVDHGDGIVPAYGYRVDYGAYSAAFSGDIRYDERIIDHAKGVDVLVMEVISAEVEMRRAQVQGPLAVEQVISHHISEEQAGSIFARVKPRLAVYSHIVPSPAIAEDLIPPTRRTYDGPLAVGYDLMKITIGETVEVHPRQIISDK
ncbi:MAG: MBL fold metallo-hydrolase [Acidobacteriota bacterium]|nr:MAG: MBL fold metallo-hydrolase [Acidobacteriota bacterium]